MGSYLRIKQIDRRGRSFYVVVGENEVICSVPSGSTGNDDLNAALTAVTRLLSVALQDGISRKRVLKQLQASSISKGDLPDLILRAIHVWEERNASNDKKDQD